MSKNHHQSSKKFGIRNYRIGFYISLSISTSFLSGCSLFQKNKDAQIKLVYERSAQYHKPDRNPVIVIPGILGSKLIDDETNVKVWGAFDRTSANPKLPAGVKLLSLPISDTAKSCPVSDVCSLRDQKDSVRANGVLDTVNVKIFGLPFNFRAYANIMATLGVGGYRDESLGLNGLDYGDGHFTCFQFAYDWRRDNVENAKLLKEYIDDKKSYLRKEYKKRFGIDKADIKFDIVAHSMGGLLTRYFLRYGGQDLDQIDPRNIPWAGANDVGRAVLIAPPNAGSLDAYSQLIDGYNVGRPFLPFYQAALLGTYPSIYQLLPRPRHQSLVWDRNNENFNSLNVDIYDADIWEKYGWGLASTKAENTKVLHSILPDIASPDERREIALTQQRRILEHTKKFHEALDAPASPPNGTEIFLVAGDAKETASKIIISKATGNILKESRSPGDGTVLRSSALMDERLTGSWTPQLKTPINWASVLFLSSDHLGLTTDPAFKDNVLFWLLEAKRNQGINQ